MLRTSVGCPWRVGRLHPPSQETSPAAKQNQNHWKASGAGKGMGVGAKELHAWSLGPGLDPRQTLRQDVGPGDRWGRLAPV